jgi:hypothetical protein
MTLPFSAMAEPIASSDSSLGAIEEAAGVDDDDVGARMALAELVALRAQRGDDALGIDERLGAPEGDERDFRRDGVHRRRNSENGAREGRGKAGALALPLILFSRFCKCGSGRSR